MTTNDELAGFCPCCYKELPDPPIVGQSGRVQRFCSLECCRARASGIRYEADGAPLFRGDDEKRAAMLAEAAALDAEALDYYPPPLQW